MNNIDLLTKKYWTRFAIVAAINAGIFITYRLTIKKIQDKNKLEVKTNNEKEIFPHKITLEKLGIINKKTKRFTREDFVPQGKDSYKYFKDRIKKD